MPTLKLNKDSAFFNGELTMLKVKKLEERIKHLEYELELQGEELGTLMFQNGKLEEEVDMLKAKLFPTPAKRGRKAKTEVKEEPKTTKKSKK